MGHISVASLTFVSLIFGSDDLDIGLANVTDKYAQALVLRVFIIDSFLILGELAYLIIQIFHELAGHNLLTEEVFDTNFIFVIP